MTKFAYPTPTNTSFITQSMTTDSLSLSPVLKDIDPVLYTRLDGYNSAASAMLPGIADQFLTENEWQSLESADRIDPAAKSFFISQYEHNLARWQCLPVEAQRSLQAARKKALAGDEEQARAILNEGADAAGQEKIEIVFREELVWLDLFFGRWDRLAESAVTLAGLTPDNAMALYASAALAFRRQDDRTAKELLDQVEADPLAAPSLKAKAQSLEDDIYDRHPDFDPDVPYTHPLSLDELEAGFAYFNYKVLEEKARVAQLFEGVNVRRFAEVKERIVNLAASGKIGQEEIPWICHALIRTQLTYDASLKPRPVEKAFSKGIYDCNEHAEVIQILLNAVGIKTKAIGMWITPEIEHAFVAYEIDGKWGYASVMSFSPPVYESTRAVLDDWEWTRSPGTDFAIGRLENGVIRDRSVTPSSPTSSR